MASHKSLNESYKSNTEWKKPETKVYYMVLGDSETGWIKLFCLGTHAEKQRLVIKAREEFRPGRGWRWWPTAGDTLITPVCEHLHSYAARQACLPSVLSVSHLTMAKIRKKLQVATLRLPSLFTEVITVYCSPSWHLHLGVRSSVPGRWGGVHEWVIKTGNSRQNELELHMAQEICRQPKLLQSSHDGVGGRMLTVG